MRKVKYTPPAAAMPVVRSPVRTETVDEKKPVVQRSRSGVVSHKGKQETENKPISLPPPPVVSTKVSEAPPPVADSAAVEGALAVGEHVDESPMLSTDSPDILSSSPCLGDPGDKSQGRSTISICSLILFINIELFLCQAGSMFLANNLRWGK